MPVNRIWLLVCLFLTLFLSVYAESGILFARNNDSCVKICISYNPRFEKLPDDLKKAVFYPLADLSNINGCNVTQIPNVSNHNVMLARGDCLLAEKAANVESLGGKSAIVPYPSLGKPSGNESDYDNVNITIAIMDENSVSLLEILMMTAGQLKLLIKELGNSIEIAFYSTESLIRSLDLSIIIIGLMAMFVEIVGGYWSGIVRHELYVAEGRRSADSATNQLDLSQSDSDQEQTSLNIGPLFVLCFVVAMCGMLLLLYYFYDYLVYVLISLFCISTIFALFFCLAALISKIPCNMCKVPLNWPKTFSLDIRLLIIFFGCASLGVCWAVYRNASFAWILQDILGIAFCINALKTVRLPNLKVCVILLVLLLIYDIFFVFITPLFTKTGESVMVEVATGGASHSPEQLPVVLKVPHFKNDDLSVCHFSYSLLGFGDLLIPGLLISFCHAFDLKIKSPKIYFISTTVAYGIGLIFTFVALALMQTGQPALLYLVPCTVLTVVVIGWRRGELKHLWQGELTYAHKFSNEEIE